MPRSGTAMTHRVLVLLSGAATPQPGWLATDASPLAGNEPVLNAWVTNCWATPARCAAPSNSSTAAGAVAETRLPAERAAAHPARLRLRHRRHRHRRPPSPVRDRATGAVPGPAPPAASGRRRDLRLQHARPTDLAAGEVTLFDLLEQARGVRTAAGDGARRGSGGSQPARAAANGTIDLADLEARIMRGEDGLNAAHKAA